MTLRERIRFTRTLYGLTQTNLGDALGVSRNYICMVENNSGNVQLSLERATEILNMIYKIGEEKKKGRLKECLEELKEINKK